MLTDKELEEIRRKMLELEEEPPMGGWRSIQAEVVQPKKDWRPLWWLLSLMFVLLIGLGTYHVQTLSPRQEITLGEQRLPINARPFIEQPVVIEAQKPAPATPQPIPRAEAQVRASQEQAASRVAANGTERPVELISEVGVAEGVLVEGERPVVVSRKNQPEIPFIPMLPNRKPEIIAPVTTTSEEPISKVPLVKLPNWSGATIAHTKGSEEIKKSNNANETTTTLTPNSILAGADSMKQEKAAKAKPADTTEKAVKEEKKPATFEKRLPSRNEWSAGLYFAPRYAFRKFVPNAKDDILITSVSNVNQLDPKRMGYEFGANFSRVLNPNLFVEAGLSWMQLKENVTYTLTTGQIDTFSVKQSKNGQIVVESKLVSEERQLISSYAYGGLRLGITQYFLERGNRRLNVTVAGGANLLIKGETKQFSNGEWTETVVFPSKENILEQTNYNLQVGVGYNVSVLQKYEVMLMPTMSYFLGSTFKEREPLGLRPYSLGVNLQLKRRFNL